MHSYDVTTSLQSTALVNGTLAVQIHHITAHWECVVSHVHNGDSLCELSCGLRDEENGQLLLDRATHGREHKSTGFTVQPIWQDKIAYAERNIFFWPSFFWTLLLSTAPWAQTADLNNALTRRTGTPVLGTPYGTRYQRPLAPPILAGMMEYVFALSLWSMT